MPSPPPAPPPTSDPRLRALVVQAMLIGGLIVALLTGGAALLLRRPEPPPVVLHPPPTPAAPPAPTATPTPAPIVVYVNGAVARPGVYTLPVTARAGDALAAAGGTSAEADGERINLAAPLFDGAQLYVPRRAATGEAPANDGAIPPAGISGAPATEPGNRSTTLDLGQSPVNINTATVAELEALPGIGPQRAADIVAHRPYASLDDLDAVPGIGPAILQDLRDLIIIE